MIYDTPKKQNKKSVCIYKYMIQHKHIFYFNFSNLNAYGLVLLDVLMHVKTLHPCLISRIQNGFASNRFFFISILIYVKASKQTIAINRYFLLFYGEYTLGNKCKHELDRIYIEPPHMRPSGVLTMPYQKKIAI